MSAPITPVKGNCPMGCGAWLMVDDGGLVFCSHRLCPDAYAVTKLLAETESEHIVKVDAFEGVTVKHPLRERIADDLFSCGMLEHVTADRTNDAAPVGAGRYRVIYVGHDPVSSSLHSPMCSWERLS